MRDQTKITGSEAAIGLEPRADETFRPGIFSGGFNRSTLLAMIFVFIGYYLGCQIGLELSYQSAPVSVIWPPNSILLSALLLSAPRIWWLLLLAALPAHLAAELPGGVPPGMALGWFVSNSCEALLGASALHFFIGTPVRLNRLRDLKFFFICVVLAAPFLSSFLDAGFVIANHWRPVGYWMTWRMRFFSNALTAITLVPVILSAGSGRLSFWRGFSGKRFLETAALIIGLVATSTLIFCQLEIELEDSPIQTLLYVPLPFLLWAAVRFGVGMTSTAVLLVALIVIFGAVHLRGPFAGYSPEQSALAIQMFLIMVSGTFLILTVLLKERKLAVEILRASEERYREVVECQSDLICRYRPDTTLTFVNDAYCRFFGRSRAELIGRKFLELIPEPARPGMLLEISTMVRARTVSRMDREIILPDGTAGWQHWTEHVCASAGETVLELQGIGQDITDRKRIEEMRQTLSHASRLAMVGELTAMIAHEINQPLGAILSNADAADMLMARSKPPLEEIRPILQDIRKNDLRASESIVRIRALLRRSEMELLRIDVNQTVVDVLRLVAGDSLRRKVQIQKRMATGPLMIMGDQVHLQQVLLNLILNAMDAMAGQPETKRRIVVETVRMRDDTIEIIVNDLGPGVPPDKLARIFESFYTTKKEGMGLGLSIARSIIQAHGGQIRAENNPAGGASFHCCIPLIHNPD